MEIFKREIEDKIRDIYITMTDGSVTIRCDENAELTTIYAEDARAGSIFFTMKTGGLMYIDCEEDFSSDIYITVPKRYIPYISFNGGNADCIFSNLFLGLVLCKTEGDCSFHNIESIERFEVESIYGDVSIHECFIHNPKLNIQGGSLIIEDSQFIRNCDIITNNSDIKCNFIGSDHYYNIVAKPPLDEKFILVNGNRGEWNHFPVDVRCFITVSGKTHKDIEFRIGYENEDEETDNDIFFN